MQDSALILLAGVLVCFLTIASVFANVPVVISGMLCFGGVGLVFAAMYEMTVNYN